MLAVNYRHFWSHEDQNLGFWREAFPFLSKGVGAVWVWQGAQGFRGCSAPRMSLSVVGEMCRNEWIHGQHRMKMGNILALWFLTLFTDYDPEHLTNAALSKPFIEQGLVSWFPTWHHLYHGHCPWWQPARPKGSEGAQGSMAPLVTKRGLEASLGKALKCQISTFKAPTRAGFPRAAALAQPKAQVPGPLAALLGDLPLKMSYSGTISPLYVTQTGFSLTPDVHAFLLQLFLSWTNICIVAKARKIPLTISVWVPCVPSTISQCTPGTRASWSTSSTVFLDSPLVTWVPQTNQSYLVPFHPRGSGFWALESFPVLFSIFFAQQGAPLAVSLT